MSEILMAWFRLKLIKKNKIVNNIVIRGWNCYES